MLMALDPHSSYLNPKQFRDMQVQTKGEFGGIGLEVTMENGLIKVVSPIEDTPAAKAGLQSGDLITALDKEQIQGLTLQEAVEKMRGPVKAPITLTILRKGVDEPFDVKMIRDLIHINPVKYNAEDDVGYIRITTFNEETTANLWLRADHHPAGLERCAKADYGSTRRRGARSRRRASSPRWWSRRSFPMT